MEHIDNRATYKAYPFLTEAEFAEACHYLDSRYSQATLGHQRALWRLNVHHAICCDTDHFERITFLQISTPLAIGQVDAELASLLNDAIVMDPPRRSQRLTAQQAFAQSTQEEEDQKMVDAENADKEVLRSSTRPTFPSSYVTYEIHLHPTYRAPCLWFSLHNLPLDESPLDVGSVFRHLVPEVYKTTLRGKGSVGGISIEHHPLTGVPTFFVHPCFIGDAMAGFNCSKQDYLTVWIGLTGGCVGLWVPKEMAMNPDQQPSLPESVLSENMEL